MSTSEVGSGEPWMAAANPPMSTYRTCSASRAEQMSLGSKRREWDSNPRRVAPHTLSKRADSAALASLPGKRRC
jgi:hypothetical protein